MASIKYCSCDNKGFKVLMKKAIIKKWISGTQQDVARYTCPACGRATTVVDTHGTSVTQSVMNTLSALTS